MKYKIGDFVRFIDEQGEGYITSILDGELIGVTDEDGFEIPVLASKVTTVHGREKELRGNESPVAKEEIDTNKPFIEGGVMLVLQGEASQGLVSFFLVNTSSYELLFSFNSLQSGKLKGEKMGTLAPQSVERIYTANAGTIANWPTFKFRILFHTERVMPEKSPLLMEKKIRAVDLSSKKKAVPLLEGKGWVFEIEDHKLELDTDKLKEHFISHRPAKRS